MGYADYLRQLLRPMGVYALGAGSLSGGEVEALGAALDDAWDAMRQAWSEAQPLTATDEGLARYERLFGVFPQSEDLSGRRAAIAALMQVGGDSFSPAALTRCLRACGVTAAVSETDTTGTLEVSFPDRMGRPEGFERMAAIIELLLPCHLAVEYFFRYAP